MPSEALNPANTWKDKSAYDAKANDLAAKFRANDKTFDMPENVRAAGPRGKQIGEDSLINRTNRGAGALHSTVGLLAHGCEGQP